MKKAGLLALLIASFSLAFAAPAANANRWDGIEPRGNFDVSSARYNDNDTLGEDMREGYRDMKNGINRAANRVENDVNRATNRIENGVNRATNRVENGVNRATNRVENGVSRVYDTRDTRTNGRYNTLSTTDNVNNRYRVNATDTTSTKDGFSWGWLGLLGLLGLAGMRSRERDRA
ncbi:WGxxGxxG family protein [Paenibacillus sp. strain BS8-2]